MWDLVLSNLGILGNRKKSNNKAVNGNIGPVASTHADLCGLWEKMGPAIYKVESKPNVFEKNCCQTGTKVG